MKARYDVSRRAILRAGVAATGTALLLGRSAVVSAATGETDCKAAAGAAPLKARPERAVSLRQLSETLAAGRPARLEGLTRLDGFIVDKENRDIIVWGLAERGQPELHVADLVVALRSAHGRYTIKRDETIYRVNPVISIDPDTAVLGRLRHLNLMTAKGKRDYAEICKAPQTVRVEGMPRGSRVAKVLVEADYRMKMVSQGRVTLPIRSPFSSTFETSAARWREEAAEGMESQPVNTRYWFQPGQFSYQASADSDTVFIDVAQVVLNDEDQYLKGSALVASGRVGDEARAFTCAWTDRMEDIYKAEPVWRDMHNIFRHFAVARIMRDRDIFNQAGFAAEFLLDRFEIPNVVVPASLPGLGRVEEFEQRRMRLANAVCGGVSVGHNKPIDMNVDAGETQVSGHSVVASRPNATALAWAITPGTLRGIFDRRKSPGTGGATPPSAPRPDSKQPSLRELFKT